MAKKKAKSQIQAKADMIGWSIGIAGILMFLFGIILFLQPAQTVEATVFILGLLLVVVGGLKLAEGLVISKKSRLAGFYTTTGLVALLIGLVMLLMPTTVAFGVFLTFGILAILLAFLALASGIWQVIFAINRKKQTVPLLIGVFYILFGLLMLFNPLIASLALVSMIGLFTMFYGLLLIIVAGYARDFVA